ncbi:toxin of TA system [Gordonia phage Daredevil]|uniref:Toxin n=1 Tax=Gordonia phage Daredevil TaxID=2283286 RepID=A0A345MIY3_9CAUD|nr:toxin of TA system [Gordonia phage Daredevil]AXH70514.1 toxin [Gordonia phage Daredevil]
MIQSFGDSDTEMLFNSETGAMARYGRDLAKQGLKRLLRVHAAVILSDLKVPPGHRLEALSGNLDGMHSIRINDQYRIVFRWTDAGPEEVQIVDYH